MKRPAETVAADGADKRQKQGSDDRLAVSTLCGFLGAGKTTLLKHILEKKHSDEGGAFKCAVIVNDVAELNIDAALIDQQGLVQSEDVIAMQNGCICCTLQNDLVTQITTLAKQKTFNYMIIEASGVSEPAEIAKIFADCEEDHDHDKEHGESVDQLHEHARLDTCVTVVDTAEFFNNFEMIKQGPKKESFPQLLVEQVHYANVVILNKMDLVSEEQLAKVQDQVAILNPKAQILTAKNSNIDVAEVLHSGRYKAADFASIEHVAEEEEEELKDCCKESMQTGGMACCRGKRTRDSGLSKVVLGYTGPKLNADGKARKGRHAQRFGITSLIYQARRPFHPERFDQNFVTKFFVLHRSEGDDESSSDEEGEEEEMDEEKLKKKEAEKLDAEKQRKKQEAKVKRQQADMKKKHKLRINKIGDLYRSKGFLWLANNHDLMGVASQASGVITIEFPDRWNVLQSKAWEGTPEAKAAVRKDFKEPYGDRRQDLVFIGRDLKEGPLQELLDSCLLTDEEMAMGHDGWKAVFGDAFLDATE